MTDPIADMLIQIKNAYLAHAPEVKFDYSRMRNELSKVLLKSGYIKKIEMGRDGKKKILEIVLLYEGKKPPLEKIEIVSKPSVRRYLRKEKIGKVLGGIGIMILSTSQGLMTGEEAKKKGVGGEIICRLW